MHKIIIRFALNLCLGMFIIPLGSISSLAAELDQVMLQQLHDRAEIETLLVRYIIGADTRNPDIYVSVFTQDAEFDLGGQILVGHEKIRQIIVGMNEGRAKNDAEGKPNRDMRHVMANATIEFIDETHALHQSYWQTVVQAQDKTFVVGAMGQYNDELVKQNGKWLIQRRKLTSFTTP